MNPEAQPADDGRRPDSPAQRIDAACDRFEAAWRAGQEPRIEDVLAGADQTDRPALLRELLALELELRRGRGERVTPGAYRDRFPGQADLIDAAFAAADTRPGRSRPRPSQALADTGRNLLLGLLALQNNFVSREALLGAFAVWVADKARPLGQVLRDRGALDEGRYALLEALVAEHLKLHDDDPDRSLAALSSLGSARRDLERIGDADVQASLARVATDPKDEDPDATRDWRSNGPTTSGPRFRILRPHAKGGLGEVFVARDEELNREVALKQIQDDYARNPESRARFVREAEITGRLEHPGIVPVYGLGHYDDGRPYYAMRFIAGDSLKEAIDAFHRADRAPGRDPGERSLALRRVLQRFIDVCDAVGYAHSRRVLHRDLKPGNILLGRFGETLVVDWGLAKPMDRPEGADPAAEGTLRPSSSSSSNPTEQGSALGTPAYMSPEQAAGRHHELGPASDVYSLGATLYCLLTGRAPFEGRDVGAVLQRVRAGDFQPPRLVNKLVPPALEAVCLKAMALQPADRYRTTRELAEEVEHWLADEPVSAWRESISVHARRWMRRHRTLVTSTAAVVLFSLFGLAGFASVLAGKNQQLDAKNVELADKNRELDRQRQRAEEREALAIDAVKKFRDAVQTNGELKNNPKLDALRKALLKEPLDFFRKLRDQLQAERDARPDTLAKLASASFDLARTMEEIGSISDAIRSYSESIAISEGLVRDHPAVNAYQVDLAKSHNKIGNMRHITGHPGEALESYRRAMTIWERLAQSSPTVTEYQSGLAVIHVNIGHLLDDRGQSDEAMESYRQALAIVERLNHDHPAVTRYESDLAQIQGSIALVLSEMRRPLEALEFDRRALVIQERLARDNPSVTKFRRDLATSHLNIGVLLFTMKRRAAALESYRRALDIFEGLAHENPTVADYLRGLAAIHNNIGNLLHATGRPTEALASQQRALEVRERLARDNPSVLDYQSDLGATLSNIAIIEMGQARWREALERLEQAVEHQRKALAAMPRHPGYRQFLRNHLSELSKVHRALNQPAEAVRSARECAKLSLGDSSELYDATCAFSLTVPLTVGDQRHALAAEAVATLKQAIAAGWSDAAKASRDPDLAPLHDRDDFRRLLAELFDRGFPADPFAP